MKPILEIKSISKKFQINHEQQPYLSLRDTITDIIKGKYHTSIEDFWALLDVSFDVYPGESIGIIGKNGSGKSTLLKILSKITPPTKGKIISRGKIASLLEVGTGFHPELTGRENIYLNGSILGMKKIEIQKEFDAIVDFSGVEKFLDTPLKHYSSGMQLRLAFAVAAFLKPDILVIDEVLAVGDAEFQKKCLGKMEDVTKSGRTILFVSHNMDAIEKLCTTSILLANGVLIEKGTSSQIINKYLIEPKKIDFQKRNLTPDITLEELTFTSRTITTGDNIEFKIIIKKMMERNFEMTDLCLLFYNYKRQRVAIYDLRSFFKSFLIEQNILNYTGNINKFNLVEGEYNVGLFFGFNSIQGDLYDITNIIVKSDLHKYIVQPYDLQYRGYVELI